ncbi:PAS domain S-box protein [Haloplanus halophilus]|uniref:PAS domain S-box protein n=1 Tax=Haloplanus halophilus TaxID=2949993 RepID=UPI00203DDA8D|nr:PAS domain S-box protein [Haloplanus sp. GDY1]
MTCRPVDADIDVLFVEPTGGDGPDVRKQLAGGGTEFAVSVAHDAEAARAVLRDACVDCAVCVHDPPRVDGVEALAAIRSSCPDLPVLLATEAEGAAAGLDAGATDVVRLIDGEIDREVVRNRIETTVAGNRDRSRFERIFQAATDGIAVHDPETGAVIDANRRLYELLGRDPDGESLDLGALASGEPPDTEERVRERIRAAATGGQASFEWPVRTADGERTWVEATLEPATIAGRDRVLSFVRPTGSPTEGAHRRRQFEAVFDHPSSFTAVLDAEGRIRRANRPALDLVDAAAEEIEGRRLWEAPWWDPDGDAPRRLEAAVEEATRDATPRIEVTVDGDDGERVIDLSLQPITAGDGDDARVASVVAVGYDITERKRRERALRESRRVLERLHGITAAPERSFDDQIDDLLAFGCAYLDTDVAFLSRIDEEAGRFEVVRSHGDHPLLEPGAERSLDETYCRHTLDEEGESLVIRNAADEGMATDPAYETYGFGCYLGGTIRVGGDLYGTLCFADEEGREEPFSPTERTVVDTIRRWLRHELERDEYRREIAETRDRLERILERVDDGFFALDDEWRVTYANEEGAAILREAMGVNYGIGGLLGRHLWDEIPEAVDTAFYERYHEAMETQEPVSFEAYFEPMECWFDVNAYPDEDGISVHFQDVTERKRRERVLDDLLETTQEFMQARDAGELAGLVVEATSEILGYDSNIVRLHDAETNTLPPTVLSRTGAKRLPQPPNYDDDEGIAGRVFQSGEPLVVDDLTAETSHDYGPFRSAIVLPLGDHGTLGIGSEEPDDFDDEDVALAELLATTARVSLDRIDRETELRRFRRVIEQVEEMVFLLDDDGDFTFVTEPFADFVGYDRSALEDRRLVEFVAPSARREYAARRDELDDAGADGSVTFETSVLTGDGAKRPVELALSTFPPDVPEAGIVGTVTDIRELTETRERLEAERDRFRHLFENLPDPVAEVEMRGDEPILRRANPAFTSVFGFEDGGLQGRSLDDLIVPNDGSPTTALDASLIDGERESAEARRETADGHRDFLIRWIPYRRDGHEYGFAIYTDITDQKKRERYLQVLNRVLRHNLRNDLNVIMLSAEWLASNVDPEFREQAETLRDNASDLAGLSEKAKELERIIGRRDTSTSVDAVSHLEQSVEPFRDSHPDADITLDVPSELPVTADEDLSRVFEELIENALAHNDDPSPSLRIEATAGADWHEIRFHDDGDGIPDDEWAVVTGEKEITQLTHSSGLGLWLVRWVIDSYGGAVRRLRSHEDGDGGTTVQLRLRPASAGAERLIAEDTPAE